MFEVKEAPSDIETEQVILGSIFLNDKLISVLMEEVKIQAFYLDEHKDIATAMYYLAHKNQSISYQTVIERLKAKKKEFDTDYILSLATHVPNTMNFEDKIERLLDVYRKRELYNLSMDMVTSDIGGIASSDLVTKVEDVIENMGITSNIEYERFEDYIDDWLEYQEDETPIQNHKLGYKALDDIVLLENSNLLLIGARPSVGKSAFATNLVKNSCLQGKHPLFISLEMNKKEFLNRLVANMAHVPARKLKRKEKKTPDEWSRIMQAHNRIKKFKFNFYDKGGMTIEALYGLAKYLKKKGELDIVFIDYLQLLETHQYRNQKQNQVSYISQKLKQLAMELDIPVVALAQLNRASVTDGGKPREPHLADLRDSGSLEQDANIVVMLHTDDVDQKFADHKYIKLFVRKNRDGRLGQVNYTYYGDFVEFEEKMYDPTDPRCDRNGWVTVEQDDLYALGEDEVKHDAPVIEITDDDLPF